MIRFNRKIIKPRQKKALGGIIYPLTENSIDFKFDRELGAFHLRPRLRFGLELG